ncbi:MAG: alpha/beta fold hydrolase [Alphaproteobacteria bacterium]
MPARAANRTLRLGGDVALAGWEYLTRQFAGPLLTMTAPRPESPRAVMTLPGFTGSERSLTSLNSFLGNLGYLSEPWVLGRNRGYLTADQLEQQIEQIAEHAEELAHKTGETVSLVGHSLGGVYAREAARRHPALIDRVITLGSPAHMDRPDTAIDPTVQRIYHTSRGPGFKRASRDEPPKGVALVSIYSHLDAVVSVQAAEIPEKYMNNAESPRENIVIPGSHLGMTVNALAHLVVADRLAEPLASWRPFSAGRYVIPSFTPSTPADLMQNTSWNIS